MVRIHSRVTQMEKKKGKGVAREGPGVPVTSPFASLFQLRSQGLSSLPPLVVGTETLVAAGHVTTQNLGGRKICWKGGATGWYFNVLSTKCT